MNSNKQIFTIMSRINEMSHQFTKTDWKIYQFIKSNPEQFISLTASTIAKEIETSDASIIRFSQKVGFSGFYELRYMFQKELGKSEMESPENSIPVLLNDTKTLLERLYAQIDPVDIVYLRDKMLQSQRIFIIGMQANQQLVAIIAQKFLTIGILLQTITTLDALKLHADLATQKDLCIILASPEQTKEANTSLKQLSKQSTYMVLIADSKPTDQTLLCNQNFIIPKKNDLKSACSISNELLILSLFDIIFDSFLEHSQCIKILDKHMNSTL